jgi:hypothetical protein
MSGDISAVEDYEAALTDRRTSCPGVGRRSCKEGCPRRMASRERPAPGSSFCETAPSTYGESESLIMKALNEKAHR